MSVHNDITSRLRALADDAEARNLMRFFKTGTGEYGEGDRFLGIRVPVTRSIVKEYRQSVTLDDIPPLVSSPYHEIRLAGFLLLIEIYNRLKRQNDTVAQRHLVDYYLSVIGRGNNWDLVDLISYKILGDWLIVNPKERHILNQLADMDGYLWHQRVAIVSTLALIRNGEYGDTIRIANRLLHHSHDLIHKAVGWMLREAGKRGGKPQLLEFLDNHAGTMPRTMLRYAIEHLSSSERQYYMSIGRPKDR